MPRKLRLDSDRMEPGIFSVNRTIREGMQLGRMWRNMVVKLPTPMAWAASTYSFSRRDRVWDRTTRAVPAQDTTVRARKMLTMPLPRVYMTTMASSSEGNAMVMSARRMMMKSTVLPR